jgi:ABC transporter, phosphonate, periplasmic substrate-binding protein
MSLKFVCLLAEPLHTAYRELCEALTENGFGLEFQVCEDWQEAKTRLCYGEADLGAVCGLLYTLMRAQGVSILPLASPLLAHPRYNQTPHYWADVVVRKDTPLRSWQDLESKEWLYNEPGSYSGYHAFGAELKRRGLTNAFLGQQTPTGSHGESLKRLLAGEGDFTVLDSTFLDFLQNPQREKLTVLESLGPAPAPLVVGSPGKAQEFLTHCRKLSQLPKPFKNFVEVTDRDFESLRSDYNLSLSLDERSYGQYFVDGVEGVVGRPFTSLEQQQKDQDVLQSIAHELLTRFDKEPSNILKNGVKFHKIFHQKREHHHYLINHPELANGSLSIVGFLSQMKPDADIKALFEVDDELLDQLGLHEGFLTYSPTEYRTGLWANLAVFRNARARDTWAANSTHLKAIKELGPSSYDNVRLHLGTWSSVDQPLQWIATRYLNYTADGLWRGVRTPF